MKTRRIYRKFSDPSFPLLVQCDKRLQPLPNFTYIHWHPEPELIYVEHGEYEIFDEDGCYSLSTGEVCFFPAAKVHAIRSLLPGGQYWSVSFSMELICLSETHFFQKEIVNGLRSGTLTIPRKLTAELAIMPKVIDALNLICKGSREERFLGILSFLIAVQPVCTKGVQTRQTGHNHSAVETCIQYMNTNYASHITLEELAALVHLHPNYLCAVFKKYAGTTVFDYLSSLRFRNARRLLRQSTNSVSQIAELCGFRDIEHFSKRFKTISGMSPSAYRNMYNEN